MSICQFVGFAKKVHLQLHITCSTMDLKFLGNFYRQCTDQITFLHRPCSTLLLPILLPVQRLVSSHSWCTLDGDLYACIWWVGPFHGANEQARVKLRGTTSVKNVKSESFFILIKKVWSEESRSNNSTVCLLTSSFVTTIGFRSLYGILNIDEGTMIRIVAQIREVLTWIFYFLY